MISLTRRTFIPAAILVVAAVLALGFSGCSKRESELSTGRTIPSAQLPIGFAGDAVYAEVRAESLPGIYEEFRSTLSRLGLVKWDSRFDCNRFATLYIGVAQALYGAAAWHSETPAQALALAEVWYRPDGSKTGHAIVEAVTDRGILHIEPQTGKLLVLTDSELRSVRLRKW